MLPANRPAAGRSLDLPGALLVVGGLVVLVYAIEGAAEHGWGSARTLVLGGLAIALLAAFAARRGARPPAADAARRVADPLADRRRAR